MVVVDDADRGSRLLALDGVVTEVGINLEVVDSTDDLAVFQQGRTEGECLPDPRIDQSLSCCLSLVVDLHGAVLVDGQSLTSTTIAINCAVTDHNAGRTETVVVAIDGKNCVVICCDRRDQVCDVRTELIVCECGPKRSRVRELNIRHVVGDTVILDLLDRNLGVSVRVGVRGCGRGIGIQGSGLRVAL